MPTYDYHCGGCGHEFETFQSITSAPLKKCPKCKTAKLKRLIGAGAALLFKGSGFYTTDYRSDSYKKSAESETKSVTPPAETKKEGKPDAKTDVKATAEVKPVAAEPKHDASKSARKKSKPKH